MACRDSGIRRLVLASGSPRRRQLLSLLGIPFVVKAAAVDEQQLAGEAPTELALRVSQAKALAVGNVRSDELVVAADTIVVLGGKVLGKPVDAEEAATMLGQLQGRAHVVYSGVAVWHPASRKMISELGESLVWMRDYTDGEIATYVESGDPLDKAGAYAIQHPEFKPVERVEGCWLNVMGLPLCHVARALAGCGVTLPAAVPGACQAFSQRACTVHYEILERNQPSEP